ncbi:hypothetical protein FQS96_07790, partial [Enterococcus faecalis]|uniref:Rib/alpha-like domain-containing protein n=3 Tax=Enterococcus TaxID=1350 RepID=UPI001A97939D
MEKRRKRFLNSQKEIKKRYKMYKVKKHWMYAPILFLGITSGLFISGEASASEVDLGSIEETQEVQDLISEDPLPIAVESQIILDTEKKHVENEVSVVDENQAQQFVEPDKELKEESEVFDAGDRKDNSLIHLGEETSPIINNQKSAPVLIFGESPTEAPHDRNNDNVSFDNKNVQEVPDLTTSKAESNGEREREHKKENPDGGILENQIDERRSPIRVVTPLAFDKLIYTKEDKTFIITGALSSQRPIQKGNLAIYMSVNNYNIYEFPNLLEGSIVTDKQADGTYLSKIEYINSFDNYINKAASKAQKNLFNQFNSNLRVSFHDVSDEVLNKLDESSDAKGVRDLNNPLDPNRKGDAKIKSIDVTLKEVGDKLSFFYELTINEDMKKIIEATGRIYLGDINLKYMGENQGNLAQVWKNDVPLFESYVRSSKYFPLSDLTIEPNENGLFSLKVKNTIPNVAYKGLYKTTKKSSLYISVDSQDFANEPPYRESHLIKPIEIYLKQEGESFDEGFPQIVPVEGNQDPIYIKPGKQVRYSVEFKSGSTLLKDFKFEPIKLELQSKGSSTLPVTLTPGEPVILANGNFSVQYTYEVPRNFLNNEIWKTDRFEIKNYENSTLDRMFSLLPKPLEIIIDIGKGEVPISAEGIRIDKQSGEFNIVSLPGTVLTYQLPSGEIGRVTTNDHGKATIALSVPIEEVQIQLFANKKNYQQSSDVVATIPAYVSEASKWIPEIDTTAVIQGTEIDLPKRIINLPYGAQTQAIMKVDTTSPGDKRGKVTVTFPDGSKKVVDVPVNVKEPEADTFTPEVTVIHIFTGRRQPVDLTEAIKNLPEGVNTEVTTPIVDVETGGDQTGQVTVTFLDGSKKVVDVPVAVWDQPRLILLKGEPLDLTDSSLYGPLGKKVEIIQGADTSTPGTHSVHVKITPYMESIFPVLVVEVQPAEILRGSSINILDSIIGVKNDHKVVVKMIDSGKIGKQIGKVLVANFNYDTTREIDVPVNVKEPEADKYEPQVTSIEITKGETPDLPGAIMNLPDGAKTEVTTPV